MKKCLLSRCTGLAAVMIVIAACAAAGTGVVSAAARESGADGDLLDRDDPFAFRGGAVVRELREEAKEYPDAFDLRHVDTDNNGTSDKSFVTPVRL